VSDLIKNDSLFQLNAEEQRKFIDSNYQDTQNYIEQSLTEGKIDVQVGDCVQFILDGKLVKAVICFFKSGKYTYDNKIKYEAASNIVDYWRSLDGKIQTVVNEKEREPLNLISLLNLRGFAFLPYQANEDNKTYTILYDCKSEIKRLHNGYNPGKVSQAFKSFANTLIPVSTEFTVESIGALQFNTASYMTLRKIKDPPEAMKEFSAHLQSLGMADEGTITKSIQTYIQQYGLSKLCGKMVSPTDVNRQNLFKQKVMNVDREFYSSGVFNTRVNQYNVYKSNIFIQGLLTEKISGEDSIALFQSVYDPVVPELIYWFFTDFARSNPTRAMIMVFQAFAHNGEDGEFNITLLNTLPGNETPGQTDFTSGQSGGTITGEGDGGGDGGDGGGGGGGDEAPEEEEDEEEEDEEEEIENNGGTATFADPISDYIKRLIDIVKKNGLYDAQYLNALMSALKAAKIKYKSKAEDDKRLFSASTAEPERAEAAMQKHINTADKAAKKAAEDAKKAKDAAEKKAADADTLAHTRRKELLEASHGAVSKGAFDLSHLLKSKDGSNIDNQLGTCISGNNVVISCDGQTVRIDLDLATLLSTCADSFTQSALNGIGKKEKDGDGDGGGDGGGGDGGGGEEGGDEEEEEEEEGDDDNDDDDDDDDDASGTGGKKAAKKKADAAAAASAGAAASTVSSSGASTVSSSSSSKPVVSSIASSVDAEYKAYDTDYQKFKRDPVARYLDYDAEVKTFMQEYQEFLNDKQKDSLYILTEADKKNTPPDTAFDMTKLDKNTQL
jgi:uncharacterized membrane protein YgcG